MVPKGRRWCYGDETVRVRSVRYLHRNAKFSYFYNTKFSSWGQSPQIPQSSNNKPTKLCEVAVLSYHWYDYGHVLLTVELATSSLRPSNARTRDLPWTALGTDPKIYTQYLLILQTYGVWIKVDCSALCCAGNSVCSVHARCYLLVREAGEHDAWPWNGLQERNCHVPAGSHRRIHRYSVYSLDKQSIFTTRRLWIVRTLSHGEMSVRPSICLLHAGIASKLKAIVKLLILRVVVVFHISCGGGMKYRWDMVNSCSLTNRPTLLYIHIGETATGSSTMLIGKKNKSFIELCHSRTPLQVIRWFTFGRSIVTSNLTVKVKHMLYAYFVEHTNFYKQLHILLYQNDILFLRQESQSPLATPIRRPIGLQQCDSRRILTQIRNIGLIKCHGRYLWLAGITGHVKLDDNLDRLGEYLIWHRPSLGAHFQPFVDIKMTSSRTDDIVTHTEN